VAVVLPPDDERGPAGIAQHLEDLGITLGLALTVGPDHEPITRLGLEG
jgi:hypothetical protein